MKHSIFWGVVIVFLISAGCRSGKNKAPVSIKKITISYTEEYCGGAAPPEVILNELSTLKSLKNKQIEIYLSNDVTQKPLKFLTDSSGTVFIPGNIAPTVYINLYTPLSFYEDAEKNDKQYYECYKRFLKENLLVVNITENQNEFSLISLLKCNPCVPPAP